MEEKVEEEVERVREEVEEGVETFPPQRGLPPTSLLRIFPPQRGLPQRGLPQRGLPQRGYLLLRKNYPLWRRRINVKRRRGGYCIQWMVVGIV